MDSKTKQWLDALMHNDEASTDSELYEHICNNGVSSELAESLIAQRIHYLNGTI